MSITMSQASGCCRVHIDDELTIYTAGIAHATIRDALAANDSVAIDVSGVTEIDTSGLQVLLAARKEGLLRKRQLSFVGQNTAVMDCLNLMNLAHFFQFDTPAAIAA